MFHMFTGELSKGSLCYSYFSTESIPQSLSTRSSVKELVRRLFSLLILKSDDFDLTIPYAPPESLLRSYAFRSVKT